MGDNTKNNIENDHGFVRRLLETIFNETKVEKQPPCVIRDDHEKLAKFKQSIFGTFVYGESRLGQLVRRILVAPAANAVPEDMEYQLYLITIFHRRLLSRCCHALCVPFVVFFFLAWCWQVSGPILPFLIFIYSIWWIPIVAREKNIPLWGGLSIALLFGQYLLSWYWLQYFGLLVETTTIHEGWTDWEHVFYLRTTPLYFYTSHHDQPPLDVSSTWWASPAYLLCLFLAIQTFSHAFEDLVPPLVYGGVHWRSMRDIINEYWSTKSGPYLYGLKVFEGALYGLVDEFTASPRLLPLFLLIGMSKWFGYGVEISEKVERDCKEAMAKNNPALDFVGTGGARHPSRTPQFVKEKTSSGASSS
jgi:hypothetical protein